MMALRQALTLTLILTLALPALAQETLSYQGHLTDAARLPVTASYPMVFSMYATRQGGNVLWTEAYDSVDVVDGVFTVELGSITPFADDLAQNSSLYLGIAVNNAAEMTPRVKVSSALRARWAAHAQDVRGENIHPNSVSINDTEVINSDGQWVGDTTGLRGPGGPEGPQGIRGPAGPQGDPGVAGPAGVEGPAGQRGPAGIEGPQGPRGPQGLEGPQGPRGTSGNDGAQGPQGPAGQDGEQGPAGQDGEQGPAGQDGAQGPPGADGASLDFNTDTDNDGFPDWIEVSLGSDPLDISSEPIDLNADGVPDALVGPKGPQGIEGPAGPPGERGEAGPAGPAGAIGPEGPPGPVGEMPLTNIFEEDPKTTGDAVNIPRAVGAGVDIPLIVDYNGVITALSVFVDIVHPNVSKLRLTLIAPDARPYVIFDGANGQAAENLVATIPGDRAPVDSLQPIIDDETDAAGRWVSGLSTRTMATSARPARSAVGDSTSRDEQTTRGACRVTSWSMVQWTPRHSAVSSSSCKTDSPSLVPLHSLAVIKRLFDSLHFNAAMVKSTPQRPAMMATSTRAMGATRGASSNVVTDVKTVLKNATMAISLRMTTVPIPVFAPAAVMA